MMEVFSLLVGLLAIFLFLKKTDDWTTPKRVTALIVLGGISLLIFSFRNSVAVMSSPNSNANAAAIEYTTPNEINSTSLQGTEYITSTPPFASPTQGQPGQVDTTPDNSLPYSIHRSDKVLDLKRGKHYPYICDPEIKNCLGFTMKFSYLLPEGHYVKNVWLVCVRENGDNWVQVDEITINEGEEKEFTIRFDRVISFSEIVIQRPIDYNNYMHTDSLSIYNIIYN